MLSPSSGLKILAVPFSGTFLSACESTRRHKPQDKILPFLTAMRFLHLTETHVLVSFITSFSFGNVRYLTLSMK
jgi:hypothetical protein